MRLFRSLLTVVIVLAACGQPQAEQPPVVTTSIEATSSIAPAAPGTVPVTSTVRPATLKRPAPGRSRPPERIQAAPALIIDTVAVYAPAPTYKADGNRYVEENITTRPMEENPADTEEDCGCN